MILLIRFEGVSSVRISIDQRHILRNLAKQHTSPEFRRTTPSRASAVCRFDWRGASLCARTFAAWARFSGQHGSRGDIDAVIPPGRVSIISVGLENASFASHDARGEAAPAVPEIKG